MTCLENIKDRFPKCRNADCMYNAAECFDILISLQSAAARSRIARGHTTSAWVWSAWDRIQDTEGKSSRQEGLMVGIGSLRGESWPPVHQLGVWGAL